MGRKKWYVSDVNIVAGSAIPDVAVDNIAEDDPIAVSITFFKTNPLMPLGKNNISDVVCTNVSIPLETFYRALRALSSILF